VLNFATSTVDVHDGIGTDPVTLAMSPDGTRVFVVDGALPTVDIVDPATGKISSAFTLPTSVFRTTRVDLAGVDGVVNNPIS
jgi:DNA-binding beta-propeller fold protein YncE